MYKYSVLAMGINVIFNFLVILILVCVDSGYCADPYEIITQIGLPNLEPHSAYSKSINVISASGKQVITTKGNRLVIWDFNTGEEIRTLKIGTTDSFSKVFSPDDKSIISGSSSGTIILWDIATGTEFKNIKGHNGAIYSISFSPDMRHLLTGSNDGYIKVWDALTWKTIRTIKADGYSSYVSFSKDGNSILSGGLAGSLKIFDALSGNEIKKIASKGSARNSEPVIFSNDKNYFLTLDDYYSYRLFNLKNGKVTIIKNPLSGLPPGIFAPNNRYLYIPDGYGNTILWSIELSKRIKTFEKRSVPEAFTSDGLYALSDNVLWNIATGNEIRTYKGNTKKPISAVFSNDGIKLFTKYYSNQIESWDLSSGAKILTFEDAPPKINLAKYNDILLTSDDRMLFSQYNNYFIMWETVTGKQIKKFMGHSNKINSLVLIDNSTVASSSDDATIRIWDTKKSKPIKKLSNDSNEILSLKSISNSNNIVSYDHTIQDKQSIKFWNIDNGDVYKQFIIDPGNVMASKFFNKNNYAIFSTASNKNGNDYMVSLFDITTGNKVTDFIGHNRLANAATISDDGKFMMSGGDDKKLKLWDTTSGNELYEFSGHMDTISSVAIDKDSKYAISTSEDGTTRLWDIVNNKEVIKFISFSDNEWISITPEGYYNSSFSGHKYVKIRKGLQLYGIEQFYDVFYRPDIIQAKLRGEDIAPLISLTISDAINSPPPTVKFTKTPPDTSSTKSQVCYQAKSTGGGIGEIRLFQNGKLVKSDGFYRENIVKAITEKRQLVAMNSRAIKDEMRGLVVKEKEKSAFIVSKPKGEIFEECVDLETVPGENEISVVAYNAGNSIQSYMQTLTFKSNRTPDEPHLYILSVGIDKYGDSSVNLKYAAKDASDFIAKLPEKARGQYKPANIHLETILDTQASRVGILNKIDELSTKIKPGDSFILFVASHGVLVQDQYYIVTSDYNGNVNDTNTLISSNQIVDMSKKIKSLSQLFIFDTCHAGGVDNIISGLYDARMSVMAKKMGLHIYASAGSVQTAMDGYEGNGLYTHTLLQGIANGKDVDKEKSGKVTVKNLGLYTKEKTTEISTKLGHPQTPFIINFGRDNPLFTVQ